MKRLLPFLFLPVLALAAPSTPITRGRLTTDIDGAGHSITNSPMATTNFVWDVVGSVTNNLPSGGGGVTIGDNQVTRISDSGTIYWMFFDDGEAIPVVDTDHLEIPYDNLTGKPDFAEKSELAGLVASTNLPALPESATVGDLVDSVNAIIGALHE